MLATSYSSSFASHGMGMDLIYECLGGNTYRFQLAFYRDCGGVAAPTNAQINLRSASCGQNFNRTLTFVSSRETTPICASLTTECNGGAFPGAEEYLYQGTFTLPAQCTDWVISYSVCCRNIDINTINSPGTESIYVETTLNNTLATCNSSPSFSNDPVPFICANQQYCFNNGAVDVDGDSLVYSLVVPKTGRNVGDTVVFLPGYTSQNPLSSTPGITLDPVTGDLCMFPTDSTEIAVLAVLVEEYRNGVKIGTIRRDIQLRILGCPNGNVAPEVSGIDSTNQYSTKVCAGDPLSFQLFSSDTNSTQTVTMSWNNGIPAASFVVSPGPRPVGTFSWTPALTDIRATPYCFTVTVNDDNCPFTASQVFSYCVSVTGITSLVDSIREPSCNGLCDGRGAVQIVNGTPPFQYFWNDPAAQTTPIANNLCAGIYQVRGIDSVGCETTTNIAINEPMLLTANGIVTSDYNGRDISCTDSLDGMASATVNGGTPPYSCAWDAAAGTQTTDTATGLGTGTYTFTVTDTNGCDTTGTVTLNNPPPVTGITAVASNYNGREISCVGANDGALQANGGGGTAPYGYTWGAATGGQTGPSATGLAAGTYSVEVRDNNGCTITLIDSLQDPPAISSATFIASDYNGASISCNGLSDGSAGVTVTGGTPSYTYDWGANAGNQTTDTATGLAAGTYIVSIRDTNMCLHTDTITITEPAALVPFIQSQTDVYCNGESTGEGTASVNGGTGPYRYSWNTVPVVNSATVTGLAMGTYEVTVTDTNGCTADTTMDITESQPIIVNAAGVDLRCNGSNDGSAFATPTGGNAPFDFVWNTTVGVQVSDTARNLTPGWQYVTVVDSLNCTSDDSVFIDQPVAVFVTASSNDTVCAGEQVIITAQGSGGRGSQYTYNWNEGLGNQPAHLVTPTQTTVYVVTAIDSMGCPSLPDVTTVFIRNFDGDSLTIASGDNVCLGDTSFVVADHFAEFDAYTYVWNPALGGDVGPYPVAPSSTTMYTLTIFDQCGNTLSDSVEIEVYPNPTIDLPDTMAIGCAPLEVTLTDSINSGNGYTYLWDLGDGSTTIDPSPEHVYLEHGLFPIGLTVTSPFGCTSNAASASLVYVLTTPQADFGANPLTTTTQNPTITFSNTSDFANIYSWKFGDGDTSSLFAPVHTYEDSGTYNVWLIAENNNGCIDSTQLKVRIDPYFDIVIPNAFSPNPDFSSGGAYDPLALNNDVFFPHTTGVASYHLMIFNRWGELIFESFDHAKGWDGYYKGEMAQQEVYVWELEISWINGQKLKKVGDLTLFR
jgi:gliding motility-associated-like protein